MISCIMPVPLSARRPRASAGPGRPALFASGARPMRARNTACGGDPAAAPRPCDQAGVVSQRPQQRHPRMRRDPGTVRGDLQALQPAGSVHLLSAPRSGFTEGLRHPLSSQVRGTFYGCRTGQLTRRREFSGLSVCTAPACTAGRIPAGSRCTPTDHPVGASRRRAPATVDPRVER
jgi:hypothetical protein